MTTGARVADVLVVGAGMAGLVAARELARGGHDVAVVDKGRRPGGRMATRRVRDEQDTPRVFDHGAQFVTLREDDLDEETGRWREQGWLTTWFHGSPDVEDPATPTPDGSTADGADGHPRFRGAPTMRSLPEALAGELDDVTCGVRLERLEHVGGRWRAVAGGGAVRTADAVVVTAPAPQALALLDGVGISDEVTAQLRRVVFDPCWSALVAPTGPTDVPDPGMLRFPPGTHPVLDVVADNVARGSSTRPAVTVHATPDWTRDHLEDEPAAVAEALRDAARGLLGVDADALHAHRWRYSAPTNDSDDPAPGGTVPGPLRLAGDAFTGGRVEGAALSGLRAAQALLADLG